MRILVLGGGLMGPAAAANALADPQVEQVMMVDRDLRQTEEARQRLATLPGKEKLATMALDVAEREAAARVLAGFDAVVSALPQGASALALRAAAAARRPLVDLTWPAPEELPSLRRELAAAGVPFIGGCGIDPGLAEVLARHLAERLTRVEELHLRCGGIPEHPAPPLGYRIVFGGRRLPLRAEEAKEVREGELRGVPRYSGVERLVVPEVGEVEAYHEGFNPTLLELPALRGLREGTQKTLRWPGYAEKAALLRDLGLLGGEPVTVDGVPVVPRRLLDAVAAPRLRLEAGERDLVVLRVEAVGEKEGRRCRLSLQTVDRFDAATGLTAMARATGFTAAIVARMAARGEIAGSGILPPEQVLTGPLFRRLAGELANAGIRFTFTEEMSGELEA
jgi:lysine 6-dehydrogenase